MAPDAPTMEYTATRTKPEDYESDDTLVESDDEGMKARTAQMGDSKYSAYKLDELVMKAQESTSEQSNDGDWDISSPNKGPFGPKMAHSLLWETTI
jgi:hypothetical protein